MHKRRPTQARMPRRQTSAAEAAGIKVNEAFAGTVRDVSAAGSGVVEHPSGRVFFVPGVWTGEQGTFRVTGLRGRFGHARLETLTAPSAHRISPDCPHHGAGPKDCGGCPWQFVDYAEQCRAKESRVRAAMESLGAGDSVGTLWPAPETYGYRNRAQFKTDGRQLGYVSAGSNTLAPIRDCPILTPPNRETLQSLLQRLPERAWAPQRGAPWTNLDIDEDLTADAVVPNQRRPFRQGNSAQNARMLQWLASAVEPLDRAAPLVELFAGDGNFTTVIAQQGFTDILALDSAQEAIGTLSARRLSGVTAEPCNLYAEDAYDQLRGPLGKARILVLDPPRDGVRNVDSLLRHGRRLQHVVYVSCDLATFSRDVSRFLKAGFHLEEVQPLDQFPHTPHIEILGRLTHLS